MGTLRRLGTVLVLAAIGVWLAGCAGQEAGQAAAGQAGQGEAQAGQGPVGQGQVGRGTEGELTLVYWQQVSLLNPYLANGIKDYQAASLVLEPLTKQAPDGSLLPVLAAEVPTVANGGVAPDYTAITYTLRAGVTWSDGSPLTAEDVVLTWRYCTEPATGCGTVSVFDGVTQVVAVEAGPGDAGTVRIEFDGPRPYPYAAFGGQLAPVLQAAQFGACVGAAAQGCGEANTRPIGTGPYVVEEFRANDTVVYGVNERYRVADEPHFAQVTIRGAEDAAAAARAVLQTGEADYAWNLLLEPAVLAELADGGRGVVDTAYAGSVERILFNFTNPDPALGERRSEWTAADPNPHPALTDPAVRRALSLALDRRLLAEQLFGVAARPTCNLLVAPPAVASPHNEGCLVQDLAGAKALLDGAGWVDADGDGVREKEGVELRFLFQTATNSVRQKIQALAQAWWREIGVETELKAVPATVFFSGDPASPDTLGKFYADLAMFANGPDAPDPQNYLAVWLCETGSETGSESGGESNIAGRANQWLRPNIERWCSPEYDALFGELEGAVEPAERARLAVALNDLLVENDVDLPLVWRATVSAHANSLVGVEANGWENTLWNIQEWERAR